MSLILNPTWLYVAPDGTIITWVFETEVPTGDWFEGGTWVENTYGAFDLSRPNMKLADIRIPKVDFLDTFTFDELVAIETAAATDPEIRVALRYLDAAGETIAPASPKTASILALLESKAILAPGRPGEVGQGKPKQ